jgi:hypothetical protein
MHPIVLERQKFKMYMFHIKPTTTIVVVPKAFKPNNVPIKVITTITTHNQILK